MSDPAPKRAMRRGLSALMADMGVDASEASAAKPATPDRRLPIEQVRPNPDQPRRAFDEDRLSDLAASIAAKGILQPLIVRPAPGDPGQYEIVAGERRWRAAQRSGLHEVPVIVREFDDTEVLEVAIIENIQRDDLNAVEEAQAFQQLIEKFGHTQDQLSNQLGKSRSHVTNTLRLLRLPGDIQAMLRDGQISAGHARAMIGLDDPRDLARLVVEKGLSVREAEKLAKASKEPKPVSPRKAAAIKDADTVALEGDVSASLGLQVSIDHGGSGSGTLSVRYRSLDDLDRLCTLLSRG